MEDDSVLAKGDLLSLDPLLQQMADASFDEATYDLGFVSRLTEGERASFVERLVALGKSQAPGAPTARRALMRLDHGAAVVAGIAHDALHGPPSTMRRVALEDLAKIGGPTALDALQQALADEYDAFRMLAWEGLVTALGLRPHIQNPAGVREMTTEVEMFHAFLTCDSPAFVQMGVEGMRALCRRLRAGATPESLGITWTLEPAVFQKLRGTLYHPERPFPLEEIAQLTGIMRRLAEMILAFRVEDHDARVPEALTRLGAAWTIPVLEEAATSEDTPLEFREQLLQCVRSLGGASATLDEIEASLAESREESSA